MISSQYGTIFTNSHYEKIQKVYSIWICFNPPEKRKNSINIYSVKEKNVVGKVKEKYLRDAIAEYEKRLSRYCKLLMIC